MARLIVIADLGRIRTLQVRGQSDDPQERSHLVNETNRDNCRPKDGAAVWISARTGQGIDRLKQAIRATVGASETFAGSFSARQRHIEALGRASSHVSNGCTVMAQTQAGELLAEELRLAQQALGEITGEMLPDELLGKIFSSFCIGK